MAEEMAVAARTAGFPASRALVLLKILPCLPIAHGARVAARGLFAFQTAFGNVCRHCFNCVYWEDATGYCGYEQEILLNMPQCAG